MQKTLRIITAIAATTTTLALCHQSLLVHGKDNFGIGTSHAIRGDEDEAAMLIPWHISDCIDQCQTDSNFEHDESCVNRCWRPPILQTILFMGISSYHGNPNQWKSTLYVAIPIISAILITLYLFARKLRMFWYRYRHPYNSDLSINHSGSSSSSIEANLFTTTTTITKSSILRSGATAATTTTTTTITSLFTTTGLYSSLLNENNAQLLRSKRFLTIMLILHSILSYVLYGRYQGYFHIFPFLVHIYLQSCTCIQFLLGLFTSQSNITETSIWPPHLRISITWPAYFYLCAVWYGAIFTPLNFLGIFPSNDFASIIGIVLSLYGMYQSLIDPPFCKETVNIQLDPTANGGSMMTMTMDKRHEEGELHNIATGRTLQIFHLSGCHLGPFMTQQRLERLCNKIVNSTANNELDMVFISGCMEPTHSRDYEAMLLQALAPLKHFRGQILATIKCPNYKSFEVMRKALQELRITLLDSREVIVNTRLGSVQILGIGSYSPGGGDERYMMEKMCMEYPRRPDMARFMLVNDASELSFIPFNNVDVVFCGYSNRDYGLVTLKKHALQLYRTLKFLIRNLDKKHDGVKLSHEDCSPHARIGLFTHGSTRVHANRGIIYDDSFPLRLGISPEHSLIRVHLS